MHGPSGGATSRWFIASRLNLPVNRTNDRLDYLGAVLLLMLVPAVAIVATVVVERRASQPILASLLDSKLSAPELRAIHSNGGRLESGALQSLSPGTRSA